MRLGTIAVSLLIACTLSSAFADDRNDDQSDRLARYLLEGWKAEREKLICGAYTFRADLSRFDEHGASIGDSFGPLDDPLQIDVRFDRRRQIDEQVSALPEGRTVYAASLPNQFIWWASGYVAVLHDPRVDKEERGLVFIDPHVAGFVETSMLERGATLKSVWEEISAHRSTFRVEKSEKEGQFTVEYRQSIETADGPFTAITQLTFDELRGFALLSRTVDFENGPAERTRFLSVTATWRPHGDTWIPEKVEFVENGISTRGSAYFEWKSVNDCREDWQVDVVRSSIPDDVLVSDRRIATGGSVVLGQLGDLRNPPARVIDPPREHFAQRTRTIWVVNAVLIVAAIACWRWRTLRNPTRK